MRRTCTSPTGPDASPPSWPGPRTARAATPSGSRPSGGCSRTTAWRSSPRTRAATTGARASPSRSSTRPGTGTTRATGSSASRGRTGRSPCSASRTSGTRRSPPHRAAIRRSARRRCGPPRPTSRATGSATRASSGWSSSSGGRWRPGPVATTSRPTSTGRSVRCAPSCPPSPRIGCRPSSTRGRAARARASCGASDAGWPSLIDELRVPSHFTAGWWDLFGRGELRDWARHAGRGQRRSRLVVEATDHAGHDWGDGPTPDPLADFDALAARMPTVLGAEVAFLRRHLLGADDSPGRGTGDLDADACRPAGRPRSWPPPGAESLCLHLGDAGQARRGPEGGSLSTRPDHIPMEARWRHDPRNLVPSLEGEAVEGWFRRPDERLTQVRDDVLTFTSDAAPRAARPRRSRAGATSSSERRPPAATSWRSCATCTRRARRAGSWTARAALDGDADARRDRRSRTHRLPAPAGPPPPPRDRRPARSRATSGIRARPTIPGTPSGRARSTWACEPVREARPSH